MSESAYENVLKGKLKLKGKALDVRRRHFQEEKAAQDQPVNRFLGGKSMVSSTDYIDSDVIETDNNSVDGKEQASGILDDRLTPSERRYLQHWEKIESQRLAKLATKSHRDRIQDFNQYLANLTEHYDIPKVGPG